MDRNHSARPARRKRFASLSARRAWIEINFGSLRLPKRLVALRKESVDRNCAHANIRVVQVVSLSARRAWIEIDDNTPVKPMSPGRSPQGERG